MLLQDSEYSSLCYTAGPCCLPVCQEMFLMVLLHTHPCLGWKWTWGVWKPCTFGGFIRKTFPRERVTGCWWSAERWAWRAESVAFVSQRG